MSSDKPDVGAAPSEVEMETVGVDEMVRQERVRSIFQSKRDCREARTKASNEVAIGDADAGAIIYRNALETYIREVEPLFSQTKKGRRYWSEYDFGEIDLRPRHESVEETSRDSGVIKDADRTDGGPTHLQLRGLRSLFESDTPISVPFSILYKDRGTRSNHLTRVETVSQQNISIQTLDKMYAVTNGYLSEIGFGVEVGKDDDAGWDTNYRENGQYDPSA